MGARHTCTEDPLNPGRLLRSRPALWTTFVLVHGWITVVGTQLMPTESFWDVDLYRYWMWQGLHTGTWPVLDGTWVYPAGAIVPMLLPALVSTVSTEAYALAWCALITALNAGAVLVLLRVRPLRRTPDRGTGSAHAGAGPFVVPADDPAVGAWWWLAFLVLLGPVSVGRLDAVVAPVSVAALALAMRRPRVSAALLTAGAWIKVAPGALLLPLVLAVRRPWRDLVVPAAAVCVVVAAAVAAGGGLGNLTSFLSEQGERGLQIESVGATPWLVVGLFSTRIDRYLNSGITTWEISGPGSQAMAQALGVAMVLAVAAAAVLLWWVRRRAGRALAAASFVVWGALLCATVLIVFNKVGSPQFIGWLAPPVVVGLALRGPGWRTPAMLVLVIAALTQIVFPIGYDGVLGGAPVVTAVLATRNVLLVALLVLTTRRLLALPPTDTPDTPTRLP
ncbi:hypothetical protein AGMMS50218_12360 [Actinomycetota bacterium]|nr:hypothetical protein AGMMS50218_12360 [Actinomycetota bacterium]